MLSQKNREKLDMNAIYASKPNVKYRGRLYENDLYHCCNWTFKVVQKEDGSYAMVDTYWSSGENVTIYLSDDNVDEFTKVFNWDEVREISGEEDKFYHHEEVYRVALDSAGIRGRKLFVKKEANRSKSLILELMEEKIRSLEIDLNQLNREKERIVNDEMDLNYIFL